MINENDTVATSEIRSATMIDSRHGSRGIRGADCLVLLSDVSGLHTADPSRDPDARLIRQVRSITPDIERIAGGVSSDVGSGGMLTKIAAARIALAAGCRMCVAAGRERHPLRLIDAGSPCTWLCLCASPACRAQAMDRREHCNRPAAVRRCRCGRGAAPWQESAAGGCHARCGNFASAAMPSSCVTRRAVRSLVAYSAYSAADAEHIRGRR